MRKGNRSPEGKEVSERMKDITMGWTEKQRLKQSESSPIKSLNGRGGGENKTEARGNLIGPKRGEKTQTRVEAFMD